MDAAMIIPVEGLPEVTETFNIGKAIAERVQMTDGDIVAVSQKIVSKSEGRVVRLDETDPGPDAVSLAARTGKDPRLVQHVLNESRNLIRVDEQRSVLITETHHGYICANAGIDQSNTAGENQAILLPLDPDGSARRIRVELETASGVKAAVVVTDSFGRAWRHGQVETAIGCAGIDPLDDWRGQEDQRGRELTATVIAVADQIAAASDLVRTKTDGVPAVVLRGLDHFVTEDDGPGCAAQLREPGDDLFR
ncbi:MAG TPA: coenzyme F420-0:L-glutamate ligase [Solirubrobacterales bacterium]|jgi:coenzyme F420-0:L-glutamate ligase/coenzyme F420-1:gamma-L-glutamate ligase|nr:coenzyme F420-0:L-glutamate ligase [Solirubrobacterales bacterium]HMU26141.1 coenzyme F420-0:L-glutamate ligase [Solirubrobacterales bacterium]HMX71878.1 coenzyme F420-0:L-glutamate ligase [Solirubrobacterales bacterium]HMY25943.1 coenzyme F420-0:L-glutamate ligase [Solirubrobacterales bacterium]HNA24992.1 coenzyme F420-0:L-glutamate ligase [Solirubrobacterales bacterium]